MIKHYTLHRIFLIFMFIFCAVAVVSFMKQQVNASLTDGGDTTTLNTAVRTATNDVTSLIPVSGDCVKMISSPVPPNGDRCLSGTASEVETTNVGWRWKCSGINGGQDKYCSVLKTVPETVIAPLTESAKIITDTADGPGVINTVQNPTSPSTATPAVITSPSATNLQATNNESVSTTSTSGRNYTVTATLEKKEPIKEIVAPETDDNNVVQQQPVVQKASNEQPNTADAPLQNQENVETPIEKSVIIEKPVIIEAKNLLPNNNPKISGVVGSSLKIEKVEINNKEDGKNNVFLSGKAEPNAVVTIYIFSSDPVVITIKTDADGNWNYELDRELADGQHEAYVAVTDNGGQIISKSEPIAFIKTAQAATVIPVSELIGNQSPIERSSQQYVLMAIVIMSIFLAGALVLIGFLSHNRNLDEGIN